MDNIPIKFHIKRISDTLTPALRKMQSAVGIGGRRYVLTCAATMLKDMARSTFGSGNSTYRGNKWPRYSKSYAKRVGSSTPTLYRTGKLKASIQMTSPRGNSVGVYSNTKYSAAQFLGSKRGLPTRRFFPMEGHTAVWRLTARADKDLTMEVGRGFSIASGGALPRLAGLQARSSYAYGNPLSGMS
jgi:hypothetical protein